jgi:hypothetical protein
VKEAAVLGFEEMAIDVGWWSGGEPEVDLPDWPH